MPSVNKNRVVPYQPNTTYNYETEEDKAHNDALRKQFHGLPDDVIEKTGFPIKKSGVEQTTYGKDKDAAFHNDAIFDNRRNELAGKTSQAEARRDDAIQSTGAKLGKTSTMTAAQTGNAAQTQAARIATAAQGSAATAGDSARINAPTIANAAQINAAKIGRDDLQFRDAQAGLVNDLQGAARGEGPSLAIDTLNRGNQAAMKGALALAASAGRGVNPATAQRNALASQSSMAAKTAADAATLRLQEQLKAREQLLSAASGARAQDIGVASEQAGLEQNSRLANMGATNTRNLAQADAELKAAASNQSADNQMRQFNAGAQNTMTAANMGAYNERAAQQAGLEQQSNLSNADSSNRFALANAELNQDSNKFNAGSDNSRNLAQGQLDQATLLANMESWARNRQNQDALGLDYTKLGMANDLGQIGMHQNAAEFESNNWNRASDREAGIATTEAQMNQQLASSLIGGGFAAGGATGAALLTPTKAAAAASDERKKNVFGSGAMATQSFLQAMGGQGKTNYRPPASMQGTQQPGNFSGNLNGGMRQQAMNAPNDGPAMYYNNSQNNGAVSGGVSYGNNAQNGGVNYGVDRGSAGGFTAASGGSAGGWNSGGPGSSGNVYSRNEPGPPPAPPMAPMPSEQAINGAFRGNQSNTNSYYMPNDQASQNPYTARSASAPYTLSDKRKKSVSRADEHKQIMSFLNKLDAKLYKYKNPQAPGADPGFHVSTMAQDLEQTELGKAAVKNTPHGKMVDYGRLAGTMLASEIVLNERMDKMEELLKKSLKKGK